MNGARVLAASAALAVSCSGGCMRDTARPNYVAGLEYLAMLQTLNADLLSHDSATLTLERWCADHGLAEPARIVARRLHDADKPLPDELRAQLAIDAREPVRYRHVQLVCGAHVLSEADNWYVPSRLRADMNSVLDGSDEPFGKVVRSLGFTRRNIGVELTWAPLPAGWDIHAPASTLPAPAIPPVVLRHRAVLIVAQQPISVVVENYTSGLFDFRR